MPEPKLMDIAEFSRLGFLQEANRQFFHQYGLALVVNEADDGTETLYGIYDFRDDPEGCFFGPGLEEERQRKAESVKEERLRQLDARIKMFGHAIQGVNQQPSSGS